MDGEHNLSVEESAKHHRPSPWRGVFLCVLLLSAEVYLLIYDVADYSRKEINNTVAVAKLVNAENEIRLRQRGTLAWQPGGSGDVLQHLDSVLTLNDSTTILEFEAGAQLAIGSDSLVTVERPIEKKEVTLELAEGSISKNSERPAADVALKIGNTILREEKSGSMFEIRKIGQQIGLFVKKGSVVTDDGKRVTEGQRATIENNQIKNIDVRQATVTFDHGSSRHIYTVDSDVDIATNWSTRVDQLPSNISIPYKVEFFDEEDNEPTDTLTTAQPIYKQNVASNRTYRVRVTIDDPLIAPTVAEQKIIILQAKPAEKLKNPSEPRAGTPIEFKWKNPAARSPANFESSIEFSHDKNFLRKIILSKRQIKKVDDERVRVTFFKPRKVYWRIKTVFEGDQNSTVFSDIEEIEILPKPLLPAPKVKSPRIRIRTKNRIKKATQLLERNVFSASNKLADVAIDLNWESVDGASEYLLEVSRTDDFSRVILRRKVFGKKFVLQTNQTEKKQIFYFRVAAVDADGRTGAFSPSEEILVKAYEEPDLERKRRVRLAVLAGAIYHSRSLSRDVNPQKANATGFVPASGELRLRLRSEDDADWIFNTGLLAEKGTPDGTNVLEDDVALPVIRAEIGREKDLKNKLWAYSYGLYASNTHELRWKSRALSSERKLLAGVFVGISKSQKNKDRSLIAAHLAPFALSGFGVDASGKLGLRFGSTKFAPTNASYFFSELELMGRFSTKELSFGGVAKLGYYY